MKKGITPVVAIILLLMITIAIIGFAFGFFQSILGTAGGETTESAEELQNQLGQRVTIENYDSAGNVLTLRHAGTVAIPESKVSFYIDNAAITCPLSADPIPTGGTVTCTPSAACATGETLKVVAPGGSVEKVC